MRRILGRLSAITVQKLKEPGLYPDGGGLYLQVSPSGSKSWVYRFSLNHRAREMGLGSAADIPLADARARASECRRLRADGIDPIEARREKRAEAAVQSAASVSFGECASRYIA